MNATLISAPSSTKNAKKERDLEMHQTKKGNQWYFGMKCHTGVDTGSGFVHTVEVTAANVHDIAVAAKLLREDDEVVYGDSAYLGIEKREEIQNNAQFSSIQYRINRRPGRLPRVSGNTVDWERHIEHQKSSVRCKVEHPYRIVKNIFGFRKTVYRGLSKNLNRLYVLFASANLYMLVRARRHFAASIGFLRPFCRKRRGCPKLCVNLPEWCRIEAPHRRITIWPERIVPREENARREKIRELLQMANIGNMDDIQNLFKETIAEFMENGLEAELDDELGYSKYDYKSKDTDNSRNGHSSKRLRTSFGDVDVSVPRDRKGRI